MARVFVSSTVADLKAERRAMIDWLLQAGRQPVHSYRPDSETVRDSCLDDINGCDLYVLILGHRYGFAPDGAIPEGLSITQLEFRRAKSRPRIALLRTSIPDVALSDISDAEKFGRVKAFREEVQREVRPAEFRDAQGLIQGLSTGIQAALEKLARGAPVVAPTDPAVLQIIGTLTRQLDTKDTENIALRNRVAELETQLRMAVARTLTAAAQPGASPAEVAAAEALQGGDTKPAEALMRDEERAAAKVAQSPQVTGEDEITARQRAADLAREQGALAFGHDARAALEAYARALEHEPEDIWTRFLVGDLHVLFGELGEARRNYGDAEAILKRRTAADADDLDALRDFSVSQNSIGNVLVAQGDLAGALAAFRNGLEIRTVLAARDPTNSQWQVDVAVSYVKLGGQEGLAVRERCDYLERGLKILKRLKAEGHLAPNQDSTSWFEAQLDQLGCRQSQR